MLFLEYQFHEQVARNGETLYFLDCIQHLSTHITGLDEGRKQHRRWSLMSCHSLPVVSIRLCTASGVQQPSCSQV